MGMQIAHKKGDFIDDKPFLLQHTCLYPTVFPKLAVDFYVESSADDETLRLAEAFSSEWGNRGPVQTHFRVLKGGLIRAVTESFYPSDRCDLETKRFLWMLLSCFAFANIRNGKGSSTRRFRRANHTTVLAQVPRRFCRCCCCCTAGVVTRK